MPLVAKTNGGARRQGVLVEIEHAAGATLDLVVASGIPVQAGEIVTLRLGTSYAGAER